jgi:hypothetical protein
MSVYNSSLRLAAVHKKVYTIVNTGRLILAKLSFFWVVIFALAKDCYFVNILNKIYPTTIKISFKSLLLFRLNMEKSILLKTQGNL